MTPVIAPQSTVSADALLYLSWANFTGGTVQFASADTSTSSSMSASQDVDTAEDDEWDRAFEASASAVAAMGARALEEHAKGLTKRIGIRSR